MSKPIPLTKQLDINMVLQSTCDIMSHIYALEQIADSLNGVLLYDLSESVSTICAEITKEIRKIERKVGE